MSTKHRNHDDNSEAVNLACQSFESSLSRITNKKKAKKSSKNNRPQQHTYSEDVIQSSQRVAQHASFVLRNLTSKRQSLSGAVEAFKHCSSTCVSAFSNLPKTSSTNDDCMLHHQGTRNNTSCQHHSNAIKIRLILCHWMRQYLRLRDGFVLLQSGECRHIGDAAMSSSKHEKQQGRDDANNTTTRHYPSRLGGKRKRKDGYTSLYSASCYSGYGWDELFDEEVGIRARITELLCGSSSASQDRRDRMWTKLMDHAMLFDNALNEHEQKVGGLVTEMEQIRCMFLQSVNRFLSKNGKNGGTDNKGKLVMSVEDKFERLELKNGQSWNIVHLRMDRQADNFQITDQGGVLPSNLAVTEWRIKMKLPSFLSNSSSTIQPKKMSSSCSYCATMNARKNTNDELDSEFMPPSRDFKDGGVKVKTTFVPRRVNTPIDNTTASVCLNEIKNKLGVDGASLEASREWVENEQNGLLVAGGGSDVLLSSSQKLPSAKDSPAIHDVQLQEDLEEIFEDIAQARQELSRCEKSLADVEKGATDDDEAWEARESLREVQMTLGSLFLSLYTTIFNSSNNNSHKTITSIISPNCFTQMKTHAGSGLSTPLSFLKKAESLFQKAVVTVKELDALHNKSSGVQHLAVKSNLDDIVIRRTLLLLRGRALTNLGISRVEQAECSHRDIAAAASILSSVHNRHHLSSMDKNKNNNIPKEIVRKGITVLKSAQEATHTMHQQYEALKQPHRDIGLSHTQRQVLRTTRQEAILDSIHALQLESLACRWHGKALWILGMYKEAASMLDIAAGGKGRGSSSCHVSIKELNSKSTTFGAVMEATFLYLVERYYGAMSLIDLATTSAEQCCPIKQGKRGSELISLACRGYTRAAVLSREIVNHVKKYQSSTTATGVVDEHGIAAEQDLLNATIELKDWWHKWNRTGTGTRDHISTKDGGSTYAKHSSLQATHQPSVLGRSGIFQRVSNNIPSAMVTLRPGTAGKKSRRYNNGVVREAQTGGKGQMQSSRIQRETHTHKIRKWGDAMLPQCSKEGHILLPYPACAPTIPQELKKLRENATMT